MDREEAKIITIIALSFLLFFSAVVGFIYWADHGSCYDKAERYEAEVTGYSFVKNYCFVKMPNESVVNLENYRDINETN